MRSRRLRSWLPRLAGAVAGGAVVLLLFLAPLAGLAALGALLLAVAVRARRRLVPWLRALGGGIVAVALKELRGRMRGRRAFAVLTLYLSLLAGFGWAVIQIQERSRQNQAVFPGGEQSFGLGQVGQSAQVGQTLFIALFVLLTLLVVFLAPAFTAGTISQERERQTFELLVATPLPALAVVLGKLLSALVYLFLLIVSSIPLMSLVFTFGGISPDDVVRAYLVLAASAIGLGATGLFFSALVRRTQVATVISYLVTLALTLGSFFLFIFWGVMVGYQPGAVTSTRNPLDALTKRPPEALVWLNPAAAVGDVVCGTGAGDLALLSCGITTILTNQPFFGAVDVPTRLAPVPGPAPAPLGVNDDGTAEVVIGGPVLRGGAAPGGGTQIGKVVVVSGPAPGGVSTEVFPEDVAAEAVVQQQVNPFGVPRDRLWPRVVASELVLALVLTLVSVLLVSPARLSRPRLPGPTFRRRVAAPEVTR